MSVKHYMPFDVQHRSRDRITDEINPHLAVRLISLDFLDEQHPWKHAEMELTVPSALELIGQLNKAVIDFCKRRDIREALTTRDPRAADVVIRP